MGKAVLISIRPKWCELIAIREKLYEVRKTRPDLEAPFKCFIYQGKKKWLYKLLEALKSFSWVQTIINGQQKVIGEFTCNDLTYIEAGFGVFGERHLYNTAFIDRHIGLSYDELFDYLYRGRDKNNGGWAWNISDLKIYDKPKDLCDFRKPFPFHSFCKICARGGTGFHSETCYGCDHFENINITRPPQSWCYVEELP